MARAKIVATIGPASRSREMLRALISAGMNVARINMSHGAHESHAEVISAIRSIAEEMNLPVAILMDLCGPKIRTGKLVNGTPVELKTGERITITPEEIEGTAQRITCSYGSLALDAKPGDRILIDDGLIELQVVEIHPPEVTCLVINGGLLNERKGINLPSIPTSLPSLTEKDRADLEFGLRHNVDFVAISFVRKPEDCRLAKALIAEHGAQTPLIAKIEKPEAVEHLAEILDVVDGVMVARGDLGVETETEKVPIFQKEIIRHANRERKVVITATQMLQSMVENPRPTRAEASDVANAILDGSDAVMLSAETAAGNYPVESVRTMRRIIEYTETATAEHRPATKGYLWSTPTGTTIRALSEAALFAADEIKAKLILVYTEQGQMAGHMATLRPVQRIIAMTHYPETYRRLTLIWGVEPMLLKKAPAVEALFHQGDEMLVELGLAQRGEKVIVVNGRVTGLPISNMVRVHRVGEFSHL
ncbi:MAG: pyruvate kinase [Blastocatellia bacterium]|nr:pyruvate kinase [Blastocatellia bacterium]